MQLVYEKAWRYKENGYKFASVICRQFLWKDEMGAIVIMLIEYRTIESL